MPRGTVVYRFGPFELDPSSGRVSRGSQHVPLAGSRATVLRALIVNAGEVVSPDALLDAGWGRVSITPNGLEKAISDIRKALGAGLYIETVRHQGYRFVARVERAEHCDAHASLDARLAPHRAFVQGQTALDTLDRDNILRARQAFEDALREAPEDGPAHTGLAMACGLWFEATTHDLEPDTASLARGLAHARTGCDLDPSGDAWSTFAFLLFASGDTEGAVAASRRAMGLEPDDVRHAIRTAYVSWGEERLRAGRRILTQRPGLASAHWFKATVFIARGAFELAAKEIQLGCAAQDAQRPGASLPALGLHLLHGRLLAAEDRLDDADRALTRELSWADCGQLYARECAANTWYALGAIRRRQGRRDEATAAFERVLAIAPRHAFAHAALRGEVPPQSRPLDAAMGQAIVLARGNRHADAARVVCDALARAPRGSAGWQLPVEPFLHPAARPEIWAAALEAIRVRAT